MVYLSLKVVNRLRLRISRQFLGHLSWSIERQIKWEWSSEKRSY